MTPTKQQIIEKAIEQYHYTNPHILTNPTYEELLESGYIYSSQCELMRNTDEYKQYLVSELRENKEDFKVKPLETCEGKIPFDVAEALRSGFYVCGTTGIGKSDIAMYCAEQLMKNGITVIVFDSTQDWLTRSSIPYYQKIKMNQPIDIHLDGASAIFDISALYPTEKQLFVEAFCGILYKHQASKQDRKPYFLIFEDAPTYLWQGSLRSNKCRNTSMLLTEGRNYSVRFGCIAQFSSMVDKNAMRYMKQRYYGFTVEPNDIKYLQGFCGEQAHELRNLKNGEFVYQNPNNELMKVQIEPYASIIKPIELQQIATTEQQPSNLAGYAIVCVAVLGWLALIFSWLKP